MRTKEQIWADDLLDRVGEADMIAAFIEGATLQALNSPSKGAITLAVEASYGEGKSFFLRRLSDQLALKHPVAFVDAWTDDLADDPLTALVATLKEAIAPANSEGIGEDVRSKLQNVMEKSGKIAKIVGTGLFKRALGLVITGAAVEASSELLTGIGEDARAAVQGQLEGSGKEAVEGLTAITSAKALTLMEERVLDFEAGRKAMDELKAGLAALVSALEEKGVQPPIIIVIDELDRCRPTYAIKLLEEIKHLFDVPGLVFIFGMHSEALGHSVQAAYGPNFEGAAYLRRFIQRRYKLAQPSHAAFVEHLIRQSGLKEEMFSRYKITRSRSNGGDISLADMISENMGAYNIAARDAAELIGLLETAAAICSGTSLLAPLLIPMAIGQVKGMPAGALPKLVRPFNFKFLVPRSHSDVEAYNPDEVAYELLSAASKGWENLIKADTRRTSFEDSVFYTMRGDANEPISAASEYHRLLNKVAQFTPANALI